MMMMMMMMEEAKIVPLLPIYIVIVAPMCPKQQHQKIIMMLQCRCIQLLGQQSFVSYRKYNNDFASKSAEVK
jgi:hypothetical protein